MQSLLVLVFSWDLIDNKENTKYLQPHSLTSCTNWNFLATFECCKCLSMLLFWNETLHVLMCSILNLIWQNSPIRWVSSCSQSSHHASSLFCCLSLSSSLFQSHSIVYFSHFSMLQFINSSFFLFSLLPTSHFCSDVCFSPTSTIDFTLFSSVFPSYTILIFHSFSSPLSCYHLTYCHLHLLTLK